LPKKIINLLIGQIEAAGQNPIALVTNNKVATPSNVYPKVPLIIPNKNKSNITPPIMALTDLVHMPKLNFTC